MEIFCERPDPIYHCFSHFLLLRMTFWYTKAFRWFSLGRDSLILTTTSQKSFGSFFLQYVYDTESITHLLIIACIIAASGSQRKFWSDSADAQADRIHFYRIVEIVDRYISAYINIV